MNRPRLPGKHHLSGAGTLSAYLHTSYVEIIDARGAVTRDGTTTSASNDYSAQPVTLRSVRRGPGSATFVDMDGSYTASMEIREGRQSNPVLDEVGALVAVTRPVIAGVRQSISEEVVGTFGERGQLPLRMLGRLRKPGMVIAVSHLSMRYMTRLSPASRSWWSASQTPSISAGSSGGTQPQFCSRSRKREPSSCDCSGLGVILRHPGVAEERVAEGVGGA
jgi:hypothetical protein